MRTWATLREPLAWGLVAVLGGLAVAKAAGLGSPAIGAALIGLLGVGAWLVWGRQPRRMLIAGLYFFAPIDITKAVVPADSRFFSPGLYVSVAHVMLVLLLLLWAGHRLLNERRRLPFTRLDGLVLVYLAWIFIRTIGSPQGFLATATAITYSLIVLGFYVASHALESASDLRIALRAVVAGLVAEFLWTAAQMATHSALALPGVKIAAGADATVTFGGEGEAFRPIGFFIHPNSLADHMTIVIPTAFALLLLGRRRLAARVWWTALMALVISTAMLLVTLSRGGWAAAMLGGAWVVYLFLRQRLLTSRHLAQMAIVAGLGLVAVVAVYPELLLRLTAPDDRSTESRLILTSQASTIIRANPWIGVGYAGYNRAAYEYIAPAFANISQEYQEALLQLVVHDHYLLVAAELGLPAMVYFLFLMYRFVTLPRPWSSWRDPTSFALAAGLSGGMMTQVLFLASDNFYADVRVFLIWLTAGTLQAVCLQQRRAPALAAPVSGVDLVLPLESMAVWPEPDIALELDDDAQPRPAS